MTISVVPKNGFAGTVDVVVQNLPSGIDALPNASFTLAAGANQSLTFSVSDTAPIGVFPLNLTGTSGSLTHSTQIILNTEPVVSASTYQTGGGDENSTAQVYDPATGAFSIIGGMEIGRSGHTATLLPDGSVLVAGGGVFAGLPSAELYQ